LVLLVINADLVVIPIGRAYGWLIGDALGAPLPSPLEVQMRNLLAAMALVVGLVGVPLGQAAAGLGESFGRWRMERYRVRRRRLERGHAG
jgi:hypothetical protein